MPSFDDDLQMAAWFESADLDAAQAEDADVTFSPNLRVHVEYVAGELYSLTGPGHVKQETASGADAVMVG